MGGNLATFVGLLLLLWMLLEPGVHFLFFPMSLSRGVCEWEKLLWELTGSSLVWWTNGPSESVESLLFTITLMRLMDSMGLPPGGPLPDCSCRRLPECARFVTQLRPKPWEDVTVDG